jgi:hypothetical protein
MWPTAFLVARRTRKAGAGRWEITTVYVVTSLGIQQAESGQIVGWDPRRWSIEALHHVGDVTFGGDAWQVRTRNGSRAMAAFRNLVVGGLRLMGHDDIAAAQRHHSRDATRILTTLGIIPTWPKRTLRDYSGGLD